MPEKKDLEKGDVFVLPPSGSYPTGFAYRVKTASVVGGESIIDVEDAKLNEVVRELSVHQKQSVEQIDLKPAEGVEIISEASADKGERSASGFEKSVTFKKTFRNLDTTLSFSIKGDIASELKLKWDVLNSKASVKPSLTVEVLSKISGESHIYEEFEIATAVMTSPTGANIEVKLYGYLDSEGELKIEAKSDFTFAAELGIENKNPFYTEDLALSNQLHLKLNGINKMGPKVTLAPRFLNISLLVFDLQAGVGVDGESEAKVTQTNFEPPILAEARGEFKLFADARAGYHVKIDSFFGKLDQKGDFFNQRLFEYPLLSVKKEEAQEENIFAQLNKEFIFSSGVGAWGTSLKINSDGTFSGAYHDTDAGTKGLGFPNGTRYISEFTGRFANLEKISDVEYRLTLEDLNYAPENQEKIENGMKLITSTPYGVDKGKTFRLYLPGRSVEGISPKLKDWIPYIDKKKPAVFTVPVLHNEETGYTFVSQ